MGEFGGAMVHGAVLGQFHIDFYFLAVRLIDFLGGIDRGNARDIFLRIGHYLVLELEFDGGIGTFRDVEVDSFFLVALIGPFPHLDKIGVGTGPLLDVVAVKDDGTGFGLDLEIEVPVVLALLGLRDIRPRQSPIGRGGSAGIAAGLLAARGNFTRRRALLAALL